MNTLKRVVNLLSGGNLAVFVLFLASTCLIIAARLLKPIVIHWDLSIQLEAAYRFIDGMGLTTAFSPRLDLSQPPVSEKLTHFPPGLSMAVVPFLYFGIPIGIALKIIYATTTLIGGTGWAALAARTLSNQLIIWKLKFPIHWAMAALLPIQFTPLWTNQGTDIILWAGLPVVALLLFPSGLNPLCLWFTLFSGVLVGVLISVRYAAAFLLLFAPLLILYFEWNSIWRFIRRTFIFYTATVITLLPTILFIRLGSNANAVEADNSSLLKTHGARYSSPDLYEKISDFWRQTIYGTGQLIKLIGMAEERIESLLNRLSIPYSLAGVLILVFICIVVALCFHYRRTEPSQKRDALMSIACLTLSFFVFSVAITFVISYSPLGLERYYWPMRPALLLLIYGVAALSNFSRWLAPASKVIVILFIVPVLLVRSVNGLERTFSSIVNQIDISTLVGQPAHAQSALERDPFQKDDLLSQLGSDFATISPSMLDQFKNSPAVKASLYGESLQYIMAVHEVEPDSIFLAQHYPVYLSYLSLENPLSLRRIPDRNFWQEAYVSQNARIYWVINLEDCPSICPSLGNFNGDNPKTEIPELAALNGLETVFVSEADKTKILRSDVPGGYRFGEAI